MGNGLAPISADDTDGTDRERRGQTAGPSTPIRMTVLWIERELRAAASLRIDDAAHLDGGGQAARALEVHGLGGHVGVFETCAGVEEDDLV